MPIPHLTERSGPPAVSPLSRGGGRLKWGVLVVAGLLIAIIVGAVALGGFFALRVKRAVRSGDIVPVVRELATLLGDRTVLVLLLNNAELRPGGGFIGAFGIVRLENGSLSSFDVHDVYALDRYGLDTVKKLPPVPLRAYLGVPAWYFRDANWSPDFKESSLEVLRAYAEESAASDGRYGPVDMVVGVTPDLFKDILRLTGPVEVSGVTLTADNLTDKLEFEVEQKFLKTNIPREERKQIIGALADALAERIRNLPADRRAALFDAIRRALREKHLMVYDPNAAIQAVLEAQDFAGRVKNVPHDFLLVADANLASLKSDPAVQRTVSYRFQPALDGQYDATVGITYRHTGRFDWRTTRYRTYTRVYVPAGSTFISGSGAFFDDKIKDPSRRPGSFDVGAELGKAVFGAFTSIEPGETRTLTFNFRLAPEVARSIRDGHYRLLVQKQLGTEANDLTLDLGFDKKVQSATPGELPVEYHDSRYRLVTDLREDRTFEVKF